MSTSDTSKLNQNLPFYLNDYDETQKNFVCFRITGTLDYSNIISADFSHTEQQLIDQFERISNDLQSSYFFLKAANLILAADKNIKSAVNVVENCSQLFEVYHKKPQNESDVIKSNLNNYIPIEILRKATLSGNKNELYSPLFTNHKGICRLQNFTIPIDCLVLADPKTKISSLYEIVIEKLILHLQAVKQCYLSYYQNENDFVAQTYHFRIENQKSALIITCIYPSTQNDESLVILRKEIHRILDLPSDRPLIRRRDAFQFSTTSSGKDADLNDEQQLRKKYLVNAHLSAEPSNVKNGKQSLVKGDCLYFHYMQDGFNDNGWGCAYRSLQTIFSWYRLQSYTNKPIPTHREIQQTLVRLGDKPGSFVGSSKWIGSMEISFCLSDMLGVEARILSLSKGSELAEKARELQYHFEIEGTPVMIGGGVLAHTIVGVDFDELTGDVKFLIFDPHYTGGEDLKTITSKGWVGWKDVKFWNENSFYNLCCPLRPKGV